MNTDPELRFKLQRLADLPPGDPTAPNLIQQILALLTTITTDPNIGPYIPTSWKGWIAAAIALLTILGGNALVTTYVSKWTNPTPAVRQSCLCGCVQTGNCVCKNCDTPMLTPPSPKPSPTPVPVVSSKYLLYLTKDVDAKALAADPKFKALGVTIEPGVFPSTVGFNGISVPCLVKIGADGSVLDALPWTGADAAAAWMKK